MVQSLWQSQWVEFFDVVAFFRSTLLPILIVALFALALVAVSARIWLPGDMLAPAPIS
ncbi:hypothetical protein WH7805_12343 [Synechococcus sp. WH 7805]|uniref:hypothetical protein n=1 Tax=unclassified Synechococcus TaxID=2626047 RepID=UPI00006BB364|nr:hypothetical protein [Synechococcus sp. WH 7805]EAR19707.1 hypothetical protein WH7805_12343 [Synechococcus sp. WH 7805]